MTFTRRILVVSLLVTASLVTGSVTAIADDTEIKISTGFDYSSGDYGSSDTTDILYIPFTGKYEAEKYAVKLTIPYLRITSDSQVVASGGEIVAGGAGTSESTESGIGDIVAMFSYYWLTQQGKRPMVDVNAKVKLGTADEDKGLGTGKTDYALELDLAKTFNENVGFGTLGYKMYGDPSGYDLDNAFYTSVGIGHRFNPWINAGAMYDFREKTTSSGNILSELTAYGTFKLSRKYKLMTYLVIGLADGSPDWGLGMTLTRAFGVEEITLPLKKLERLRFW